MRAHPFLPTGYNPQSSSGGGFGQPHNIMFQPQGLSGGVGPNLTGGQGGGNPIMQMPPQGLGLSNGQPGLSGGGPGLTGGGPDLTGNGGNPIMQVNPQGPDLSGGGGAPQTPFGPQVGFGPQQPSTPQQQGFTPYMYRLPGISNQSAKSPLINAMLRDLA